MIGIKIKKRREELDMTQYELAEKMGYKSRSSINKIENGSNDLPQSKIASFAKHLKTTPSYLLGLDDYDVESTIYGDHNENVAYFSDKPELLEIYKEINNSNTLQLLFDQAKDLTPEDLETVLMIIKGIKSERGM